MSTDESLEQLRVESRFESFVSELHENASVRRVFGDPVVHSDRTVLPVARVAYGFGGGAGESGDDDEAGSGWGGGGGLAATPMGALEVTDDETRFVRFDDRRGLAGAVALGLLAGFLLGRRGRTARAPTRRERVAVRARAARDAARRRTRSAPTAARRRARSGTMQRVRGVRERVGGAGKRVRAVRHTD